MYESWKLNRIQFWLGLVAWIGLVNFVVAVLRAIYMFDEYSWTENFLSDLGRTSAPESARLFNPAVVFLGACLIPHALTLNINQTAGSVWLRVFSVFSALGIICIGMTPYDTHTFLHNCGLILWLTGLGLVVISYFILLKKTRRTSILANFLVLAVLITFVGYLCAGEYSWHVIFQKSLVAACMIWYLHFFLVTSTTLIASLPTRREENEQLATKYMSRLTKQHRKQDRQ